MNEHCTLDVKLKWARPCVTLLGLRLPDVIKHDDTNIAHLCHYKDKFIVVRVVLPFVLSKLTITNCITINLFYSRINSTDNAVRHQH